MRKKFLLPLLLLLIPSIMWGVYIAGSWQNVGNVMQRSQDGFNYRISLGSNAPGFFYTYQKSQIDSFFLNIPNVSISDSSHKPLNTATFYQYIAAHQVYFSPLYFRHTGASGDPITVINSDSLNHQGPPYYLNYNNLTNKPTIYSFTGNSSQYTTGAGLYVPFPTNVSSFTNNVPYATYSQILVNRNAANFGQTASMADVAHLPSPLVGDQTVEVGAWLNLRSVTGTDSVTVKITYTNNHSESKTKTFVGIGAPIGHQIGIVDDYQFFTISFRALSGTQPQISAVVTGSGTILYEVGGWIKTIVGDGGL